MTLLHDAYTALIAGLTHKDGNEIHWQDSRGRPITVEPINVEQDSYIVRCYREGGSLYSEAHYRQGQRHGKRIVWYSKGQKEFEVDYNQDQIHGKFHGWHCNGKKWWERDYYQGKLHGKHLRWSVDGTWRDKEYYIYGLKVTQKKWRQFNDITT